MNTPDVKTKWHARRHPPQWLVRASAGTLLAVLLWCVTVWPAWQTFRQHDRAHARLDQQLAALQALQHHWERAAPPPHVSEVGSAQTLQHHLQTWGSRVTVRSLGAQHQVDFENLSAEDLAQLLAQAQALAQARVSQAHWVRSEAHWRGQLVFELPTVNP